MALRLPVVSLALLLTIPALASTRLTYDIQGTPTELEWAPTAFPLQYEVDQRLVQARPGTKELVDGAFAAWSNLPDTNIQFETRGVTTQISDFSVGRIVVSLADELFKDQGALAMTTYSFDRNNGNFTDADIMIDPVLLNGKFSVQMALEHEIGHVLGLDHSGVISAVMYPFISNGDSPASFDSDDRIGIAMAYPKSDPTLTGATLTGRVMGSTGAIFGAQVVAVNERGQPVATALTNSTGDFTLAGIPAGSYRVVRGAARWSRRRELAARYLARRKLDLFPHAVLRRRADRRRERPRLRQSDGHRSRRHGLESEVDRRLCRELPHAESREHAGDCQPRSDREARGWRRRLYQRHDRVRGAQPIVPSRQRIRIRVELRHRAVRGGPGGDRRFSSRAREERQ
jgi:hypothetical protein